MVIFGIAISMFIRALYIAPRMLTIRNCLSLGDMIGKFYGNQSKILAGILSVLLSKIVLQDYKYLV